MSFLLFAEYRIPACQSLLEAWYWRFFSRSLSFGLSLSKYSIKSTHLESRDSSYSCTATSWIRWFIVVCGTMRGSPSWPTLFDTTLAILLLTSAGYWSEEHRLRHSTDHKVLAMTIHSVSFRTICLQTHTILCQLHYAVCYSIQCPSLQDRIVYKALEKVFTQWTAFMFWTLDALFTIPYLLYSDLRLLHTSTCLVILNIWLRINVILWRILELPLGSEGDRVGKTVK